MPVSVVRARMGRIPATLTFNSTVEAEGSVDIYPEIPGLVKQVLVEEGNRVQKGALLVALEDDELLLTKEKAEVAYRKLESRFTRTKEMWDQHLISQENYDNARYELEQARLEWEHARLNLAHTRMTAPVGGIIANRGVRLGDRVTTGSRLMTVVKMDHLIAKVSVPGREMTNLAPGQPAVITSDFLPDVTFAGNIERIAPVIDPGSGTLKVTVAIHGSDERLRPGTFVTVQVVTAVHDRAILIPRSAVVYDGDNSFVFVVRDDTTAQRVPLKMGLTTREELEVMDGITPVDRIIIVGQAGLKDRTKITIVE
ncbi:MAG: efflux RND transporter periplasmic adaptor subunit [Candidatus Latescibacteria bacterium]|nr:efflux RND transporter periplasmic adaptor subunit [Candidatus Latescibacterota bacterium]